MQSLQDCYQGLEIQLLERRYGFTASDRKNFSAFCFVFLNAASKPGELEIITFTKKIDRSSEGYGESLVYLVLFSFIRSTGSKHHYSDKDDFESESKEKRHRRKRSRSRSRDRDRRSRSRDKRSRSRDRERRHRR